MADSDIDTTKKLYATTDAQVWAEEWCKVAREGARTSTPTGGRQ